MRRASGALIATAVGITVAIACGKSAERDADCPTGSERCACYGNDSCDDELVCRSGLCVEDAVGGAAGEGARPTGGAGNTTGGNAGKGGRGGAGTGAIAGRETGGTATGGNAGEAGGDGEGAAGPGGAGGEAGTSSGGTGGAGQGGSGGARAGSGGAAGAGGSSGVAGVAGSSGMAGAGGAGGMCSSAATASDTLIDTLEDHDHVIAPPRLGHWYTYSDGCPITPPPDLTGANPFVPTNGAGQGASVGARVSGNACSLWGAGLGFDLNFCNTRSQPYSAQPFQGISFWYKSSTSLRLIVMTTAVIPTTLGGTCVPGGAGAECDNGHGVDLPAAPSGFARSIQFSSLGQVYGQMKPFDKTQIVFIQWQVSQGIAFDFTIDDVAFFP